MAKKLKEGLSGKHFAHPYDVSGIHRLIKKLNESPLTLGRIEKAQAEVENEFYLLNLADNTKLGEGQGRSLYTLVENVSNVLSCQVPNVFLDTNPYINAYALGGENPSIVLTSALVDSFPESLLKVMIAHELGHIICNHTFYRLIADYFDYFSKILDLVPIVGSYLSMGFSWYLFDWYRKSELSADRAALLGTQDIEAVKNCILRLAGGSNKIRNELNVSEYINQGKEFQQYMKSKRELGMKERVGFLFSGFMLQHAMSTHPWPAVRLMEIDSWEKSEQYRLLLEGDYEKAMEKSQITKEEEEFLVPPPPGEDIKHWVADLGKHAGSRIKEFFEPQTIEEKERLEQVKSSLAQKVEKQDKSPNLNQIKSKKSVEGKKVSYKHFYDDSKWVVKWFRSNSYSEYEFRFKNEDCHALLIPESVKMGYEDIKKIAFDNVKKVAPDAVMSHDEKRSVNGKDLLNLKIEFTVNEIPMVYYGYYYCGDKGTVQLVTYTTQNLFDRLHSDMTDFLNGLVVHE